MNTFEAGVIARLKTASLLDVAERAAKREGLRLADCIAPGDVTGGHCALWRELAKHATPDRVAEVVGFAAADVRREMIPEARPTPAAKSVPREKKTRTVESKRRGFWAPEVLPKIPDLVVPLAQPARPMPVLVGSSIHGRLAASGLTEDVHAACARHRVPMLVVLGRSRERTPTRARAEVVWRLFHLRGRNHCEIGRLLDRDPSTVRKALLTFKPDAELLALLPQEKAA